MSRGGRMAMSEGKNVTLNITTKRSDEVINLITDAVCYAENGKYALNITKAWLPRRIPGLL